ncbi:MAG: radical SAM protein [Candidatus Zixiibacteriota bacterium]
MPFSLYLHFPFCRSRCSYCDSYQELHDPQLEDRFYEALLAETELAAQQLDESNREISTIFIGGGTPSLTSLLGGDTGVCQSKGSTHPALQAPLSRGEFSTTGLPYKFWF